MIKQLFATTIMLLICLALGSCTSFSNTVSDNWPTWLGGMPKDVPPRPGAPGYEEFLARQQGKDATTAATPAQNASAQPPPAASAGQSTNMRPLPSGDRPPSDQTAVQGGLY